MIRSFIHGTEKVFSIYALLLFTGAVLPLLRTGGGSEPDSIQGDPLYQVLAFGVYAFTALLLAAHWRIVLPVIWRARMMWLLLTIVTCSVLWSTVPELTLRRSIALFGTTLFGLYFAVRFPMRDQLKLLGWALGIAATLSVAFVIALPDLGISTGSHDGAWRGIFVHKNVLGRLMVLSAIIFLLLSVQKSRYRGVRVLGLLLSVALVVLSTSTTALLILVTLVGFVCVARILRWHYSILASLFISTVAIAIYAALWLSTNFEPVLDSFGKDTTLTGRIELWDSVGEMIRLRPWFGYGFSGFWLGWEGPSAEVWFATGWDPVHAHNGYLDLWLALGVVGLLVFAAGFVWAFVKGSMYIVAGDSADALWPVTYLTFMLIYNFTESAILRQNSIFWVLYVAVFFTLIGAPERRAHRAAVRWQPHKLETKTWAPNPP